MFSLESARKAAELYLRGHDATDPLASPVYADRSGLPPLLILAGDAEVLLDDARKLEQTARDARVSAELFVYRDMAHVWMLNDPDAADALMAFDQIAAFVEPPRGTRRERAAPRGSNGEVATPGGGQRQAIASGEVSWPQNR